MTDWQPPHYPPAPSQPYQQPPSARPDRTPVVVAVIVALVVGLAGGFLLGHVTADKPATTAPGIASTGPAATKTMRVVGYMVITGTPGENYQGSNHCHGASGYEDLSDGAEVVISSDTGRTLTITQLGPGNITGDGCQFAFRATIPATYAFYGITVTHRGTVKFSRQQMEQGPQLSIGN